MVITLSPTQTRAYEFACHQAACRPPQSGGTGGSTKSGSGGSTGKGGSTKSGRTNLKILAERRAIYNAGGNPGPQVTHTASTGTPYRNSGSIGDQVARAQHLADAHRGSNRSTTLSRSITSRKANYDQLSRDAQKKLALDVLLQNNPHLRLRAGGKSPLKSNATPENFPRGDKRKGQTHFTEKIKSKSNVKATLAERLLKSTLAERNAMKVKESAILKAQAIKSHKKAQKDQGTEFPSLGR